MLRFEHVSLSYGSQQILDDLSFEIQEGQMAVLIGPSGCGKTTTLKMINRLIEPTAGRIYLDGQDITTKDKVELRRHIGYVIQQIGLFPNMTVAQNICVVPKLLKYSKEQCDQIVRDMLAMVEMPNEQYANKYPSEMSGGQQQRIGILRALAASPPIVLMDEPFSALDPMTRRSLQQEVKGLQQKLHKTFIFVTHDMAEALDLDLLPIEQDLSAVFCNDTGQDLHQGRFASAVLAQKGVAASALHLQINVTQRLDAAKALLDAVHLNDIVVFLAQKIHLPGVSRRSMSHRACKRTFAPLVTSSHVVNSSLLWLIPLTLGTKIMPTLVTCERLMLS